MMASCSRFRDENIESTRLLNNLSCRNTEKNTKSTMKIFCDYLEHKNLNIDKIVEDNALFDQTLSNFFSSVLKENGDDYKKNSFVSLKNGIRRYFTEKYDIDISNKSIFKLGWDMYRAKLKDIRQKGLGNTVHKPKIQSEDLVKCYESLDLTKAKGLQRKIFIDIIVYFGVRGREELRQMTFNSFKEESNAVGERWFRVIPTFDKNHREEVDQSDFDGGVIPLISNSSMCPFTSLKKYISKRNRRIEAFWQRPKENVNDEMPIWYDGAPLGKCTLENMMKDISKELNLSKVYTNHCGRATTVCTLKENGFSDREVMSVTKHKSSQSLIAYDNVENKKKVEMGKRIAEKCFRLIDKSESTSFDTCLQSDLLNDLQNKEDGLQRDSEPDTKKMKIRTSWGQIEIDL